MGLSAVRVQGDIYKEGWVLRDEDTYRTQVFWRAECCHWAEYDQKHSQGAEQLWCRVVPGLTE